MKNQLWLGTAKVEITPKHPIPLAGFASRGGACFNGIAHPLYARIFWFRHRSENGEETSALLVSADLLWWGSERIPLLKQRIQERWSMNEDAILFHGTHTHSGPQTSDRFADLLGKHDSAYIEHLEETVLEGIGIAAANQEEVRVSSGQGKSFIGINRRLMVDGTCQARANKEGLYDPELRVIAFRTSDNRPKGILVHYACHPVVTPDNLISSEFCGVAMELVESKVGGQVVSGFLQGSCGDINPAIRGELFFNGTDKEVRKLGRRLADTVLRVLERPLEELQLCPLTASLRVVKAPLQRLPTESELQAHTNAPWVKGDWSRKLLASPERLQDTLPLEIVFLTLAKGLALLATNSEIVTEYGLFIKEISAGQVLPLGYTNGMIGYVVTADQIDEGGYESDWSTEYFMMPAPFDHAIEPLFRSAIEDMIPASK